MNMDYPGSNQCKPTESMINMNVNIIERPANAYCPEEMII